VAFEAGFGNKAGEKRWVSGGGPGGSGDFACRCVGLFDLRLANDDLGAVEREGLFREATAVRDQIADDSSSTRLIPMMREYTVFNVDQCDNLPESVITGKPMRVRNPDARDELADDFLRSTSADIREGHGEACYIPSRDFISMPALAGFKGADHFYNVAFHELTHWSGHKSRLDRDLKNRFGSELRGRGTDCGVGCSLPLCRIWL
jgi:hypothetical protein